MSSWQLGLRGFSVALVFLLSLTACGGNGATDPSSGGPVAGYAYVASAAGSGAQAPGTVLQYAIGANGSATPLWTVSVPTGVGPVAMISDPTGHYVYVVNQGDGTISQYSVGAGGSLAALSPATVSFQGTLSAVAGYWLSVNPSSHSLYLVVIPPGVAIPLTSSILQYAIGRDGTLSPLSPAAVTVGAVAMGPLAFDPNGTYAYLTARPAVSETVSTDGEVLQFSIATAGELTPIASHTIMGVPRPVGITISPTGRVAYVLSACINDDCDGQVAEYTVGENGLTPTGKITPTAGHVIPISLAIDTSESGAYLLTNAMGVDTNAGAVYQYSINSAGDLVPATPPSLKVSSGAVTQEVLGPNLYALSSNSVGFASGAPTGGHIDQYSIKAGGVLATAGTIAVGTGYPTAMTLVAAH